MRALRRLVLVQVLLGLVLAPPVLARTVVIRAAMPLSDPTDVEITRALNSAVETCVRGAAAMGLSWIRLQRAAVVERRLIVEMIGSDETEGRADEHDDPQQGPDAPSTSM